MSNNNFFQSLGKWFDLKDRPKRWLIISLVMVLLSGFVAGMIQTDFFSYEIDTYTIETDPVTSKAVALQQASGVKSWNTADIYKPKSASADNKVPLIMVAPGIQRTKETQASFCIELVRRGYAVLCLDPYGQGESSPSYESQSATNEGYGLFNWLDYMYTEDGMKMFDWVDYSKVGACGHSAGGNGCQKLAEREGKLAIANRAESRIQGVYITGYIREWTWENARCNIGISYSINDEGAFQNATAKEKAKIQEKIDAGKDVSEKELAFLKVGNADMRYAPEAIEIVNFQLEREGLEPIDEVMVGEQYGNQYTGTYAVINNEACLHSLQPYDSETIANLVSFFDLTMEHDSGLKPGDQLWLVKELACGLALLFGFVFILCLCPLLLLRTKLFALIKRPIPERQASQKVRGRIVFWLTFVISAVIACFLYMVCVELSVKWFPEASTGIQTWFFPQRFTNAVAMWACFNGLIGIALFALTNVVEWLIDKARAKGDAEKLQAVKAEYLCKLEPLKIGGMGGVWRTLLLAAVLIGSFFALDYLIYGLFHVDMRFMFISARVTFQWDVILSILMYLPIFFIFYFSNSLRVNCAMRPKNWPEWLSKIIIVLGNTLGLVAIVFMEYIPMIQTGTIGYTSTVGPQWLFVNQLFSIIPMMILLPLMNRYFFNKTGRAWLGPLVTCVIFIAMTGAATTIYYAL